MRPSLTATTGAPSREKILMPRRSVDSTSIAALPSRTLLLLGLELAGVGRARLDREAALREAGERADEVGRQAADHLRAQEHGVDVPVGVVVGEDRAADVGVGAGGAQVARGGEDRVDRVVRVLDAVAVGVDAVQPPGRGQELHPADGARGAHVEVAAVVGLDLVDRREDLPAHAVLDAGGLVDREQERRDAELVDEEVRHTDTRGPGRGQRVGRVRRARRAVRVLPVAASTVSLTLSFARPAPERTLPSARLTALSSGVGTWVWVEPSPPPVLLLPPPALLPPPCWLPGVGVGVGDLDLGQVGTVGTVGVGIGVGVATGPRSTMFWTGAGRPGICTCWTGVPGGTSTVTVSTWPVTA